MIPVTTARLLFVDNAAPRRPQMSDVLRSHGYEVMEASEHRQATDMVAGTYPDIIIISRNMPGFNGLALSRKLQLIMGVTQPIILMCESLSEVPPSDIKVQRLAFQLPPTGTNPWDVNALEQLIESLLPDEKKRKTEAPTA